jgi:Flp pilus assembly pilin Flp
MLTDARLTIEEWGRRATRLAWRLVSRLEEGQGTIEYAIILALIAVVSMVAVKALGLGTSGVFNRILGSIQGIG